jgi:hypothetical protein
MFLNLVVKPKLAEMINREDIKNGSNIDVIKLINEQLKSCLDENFIGSLNNDGVFSRISDLSIKISLLYEFDCEKIFYFLNDSDRFSRNVDIIEKTNVLYEQISNEENRLEVIQNDNGSTDFKKYLDKLEEKSFCDFLSTKVKKISTQKFNKFYYSITESNSKILKTLTLSKKEQEYAILKNNEQLINCEDTLLKSETKKPSKIDEISYSLNSVKDFHSSLNYKINELLKEDKLFFKNFLINKVADISKRNLFEYNFLLNVIYSSILHLENKRIRLRNIFEFIRNEKA